MKYFITVLLITLISIQTNSQEKISDNQFVFTGKIIGQDSGWVHLCYFNSNGNYIQDSCYLEKGEFKFRGLINETTNAYFYGNRKSRNVSDSNSTDIFLEPQPMTAHFKINEFKKGVILNSKAQADFSQYTKQCDSLDNIWKKMWDLYYDARIKRDTVILNKIFKDQMPYYRIERNKLVCNFINQYSTSVISAYLLNYKTQTFSLDSVKLFYNVLSQEIQQTKYGKSIKEFLDKAEQIQIGKKAPDFTQIDMNGKNISLKDFRGKYVLLEFWASWCAPCRAEHPVLKEAYSKYHDKGFIIIGISLDEQKQKDEWINAIKQDKLVWIQLCDFKATNGEIINKYNLVGKGIPSNFLINPEGKIIDRDLRGVTLEKKLNELIK